MTSVSLTVINLGGIETKLRESCALMSRSACEASALIPSGSNGKFCNIVKASRLRP